MAPSDPDRVYVKRSSATQIGAHGFDSLVDMDASLQRREVMCTNMFHDLVVDPLDSSLLYAATGAGIWMQPDAHVPVDTADREAIGRAWWPLARTYNGLTDEYVWTLAFDPVDSSSDTIVAGTRDGGIFESVDHGASWVPQSIFFPPGSDPLRDVRDFAFLGGNAYAASSAGVLRRREAGEPWYPSGVGARIAAVAGGATGTRRIYAAGDTGLHRTVNQGMSWESLPLVPRPPYETVLETKTPPGASSP